MDRRSLQKLTCAPGFQVSTKAQRVFNPWKQLGCPKETLVDRMIINLIVTSEPDLDAVAFVIVLYMPKSTWFEMDPALNHE
jgi:hypothetical protein